MGYIVVVSSGDERRAVQTAAVSAEQEQHVHAVSDPAHGETARDDEEKTRNEAQEMGKQEEKRTGYFNFVFFCLN